jgi:anti-anti-sigma regulatory factor
VQLLIAAARHAAETGQPFALRGHSAAVQDAFELLGLNLDATPAGRPA